jgi:hypothetical protein
MPILWKQNEINSLYNEKVLHPKLNELQATAICGNDISSSCLYVSALPLCMLVCVDFIIICSCCSILFRKIYGEVVELYL